MKNKKGVIWVSTVLYILISLAVLSIVLVSVQPIINRSKDKALLSQSESMLNEIDSTIMKVSDNEGTVLNLDVKISRGKLTINPSSNRIIFELNDSSYQYSEDKKDILKGKVYSSAIKANGKWHVLIYLDYKMNNALIYNLTYAGSDMNNKILSEGDYVLSFENVNASAKLIDIKVS